MLDANSPSGPFIKVDADPFGVFSILASESMNADKYSRFTFKITGPQSLCLQIFFGPDFGADSGSVSILTNQQRISKRVLGQDGEGSSPCGLGVWTEMSMNLDSLPDMNWSTINWKSMNQDSTFYLADLKLETNAS